MFQTTESESLNAITKVIKNYFQGYLNAEPETIASAFHPRARLLFAQENGNLEATELTDWLKSLEERRAKSDFRKADARIDGVDIFGEAAIAKVTLVFETFQFTDYLSLLQLGNGWKVVNKIYTVKKRGSNGT